MRTHRFATLAVLLAAALTGCNSARSLGEGATSNCTGCHGGKDNNTGAPPFDHLGKDNSPAVGAHTFHLNQGVTCETCHVVPANANSPGHIDSDHATLTFGPAATHNGAKPTYDYAAHTCSNTYCHGGTLHDGTRTTVGWSDFGKVNCTSCHGYPPVSVAPHGPQTLDCHSCHSDSVDANQTPIPGGKHMNGTVDATVGACTGCHGDPNRQSADPINKYAPPVGASGETDTTTRAVGAHQKHLQGGTLSKGFGCTVTCHVLPTSNHPRQDRIPVMTWGPIPSAENASPTWDRATNTCTNYCHGKTLLGGNGGGLHTTPVWTNGPAEATCGNCHGLPPKAPHPQVDKNNAPFSGTTQCNQCHPGTVNADGTIFASNGLHVNGQLDVNYHPSTWVTANANGLMPHGVAANYHDPAFPKGMDDCRTCHGTNLDGGVAQVSCDKCHTGNAAWRTNCTFCHGTASRGSNVAAPPVGTNGQTASTDRAVGAHLVHLGVGSKISGGIACTECHVVPTDISHVNGVPLLTFGPLAKQGSPSAAFDTTALTCSSTYCHGATLPGTGRTDPTWAPPTALTCGSCHQQSPTTGKHPAAPPFLSGINPHSSFACKTCHGVDYTLPTAVKTNHVNGKVDVGGSNITSWDPVTKSCSPGCHGVQTW